MNGHIVPLIVDSYICQLSLAQHSSFIGRVKTFRLWVLISQCTSLQEQLHITNMKPPIIRVIVSL